MHILLDVLLCDWWEMALVKVVLATQQARSDIIITRDHMRKFVGEGFVATTAPMSVFRAPAAS